jgi:hypothetical protein
MSLYGLRFWLLGDVLDENRSEVGD